MRYIFLENILILVLPYTLLHMVYYYLEKVGCGEVRYLLRYLKPFKKELILGPFFKLVEAVFELIVPLVMANIIDVGIHGADSGYVLRMGGLMVALSFTGLLSALVCQYLAARAAQGCGTVLRREMFSHINSLSHREIDKFGAPSLVTRITNDVNQVQLGVAMLIRLAVRAPFLVIGATVMAVIIDAQLALIFLAAAVGITIVLVLIMTKSSPLYRLVQKLLDKVGLLVREGLSGSRVVRAFSRQKAQKEGFDQASDELMRASRSVGRISALLNPLVFFIVNAAIIAILWFGGQNVYAGGLEQGQIVALVNYMTQIQLALVVVANLVVIFTRAGTSAARVAEVLQTRSSIADGEGAQGEGGEYIVEYRDVSYGYSPEGGEMELEHIDLRIRRGDTVGIIGGTGSGKTTLINLIMRFYDASAGEVLLDGRNVKDYTLLQLREKIGLVPQQAALFSGTVRQNMLWAKQDATDEEIKRALELAQAAEFVYKNAKGLDAVVEQGGRNLSGGQRQRLTIARALVGSPEILILDDSSSALDFATDAALRKALRSMADATVIMVSQRVSTLKNADMIVVMDDGAVAGAGSHAQLLEECEIYREICLSQTEGEERE